MEGVTVLIEYDSRTCPSRPEGRRLGMSDLGDPHLVRMY